MDLRTRLVELENEKRILEEKTKIAQNDAKRIFQKVDGLEKAKTELEENQIYHTTNFIDKMKSKEAELERKNADLNYNQELVRRLTQKKDKLEHKIKVMEEAIRAGGGNPTGNVSQISTSMQKSRIRGANPLAVLSKIDSVAKVKDENNRLKLENERLNVRMKDIDLSLIHI